MKYPHAGNGEGLHWLSASGARRSKNISEGCLDINSVYACWLIDTYTKTCHASAAAAEAACHAACYAACNAATAAASRAGMIQSRERK